MSFLDNSNSQFLSARITKKGRNAISKGDFVINYFQIGDSEYNYNSNFTGLTGIGTLPHQKVMSPFDNESGIKYPYKLNNTTDSTTYGTPVYSEDNTTIRNVMGSGGFVSEHSSTGTTIACITELVSISTLNGTNSLSVTDENDFVECDFITIVFSTFTGSSPTVTGNSNSFIYKITGTTTGVLLLDRNLPDLTSLSGNVQIVCNKCENEYNNCNDINFQGQLNPWSLNTVWYDRIIGTDNTDEPLSGYTSNQHVSTMEFLGYVSTGQTFTNFTGGTLTNPTSFLNSSYEEIEVLPSEQRCLAVIHYSELGELLIDPDRFYKYDDYISYDDSTSDTVATDNDGNDISDEDYFEVYIPFILYHRNSGTTYGAIFTMGTENYYIKSTINDKFQLMFRYLLDENGNKVGKVYPNNKIIVFDDQELVAMLDYRSNRRHTLPSPKVGLTPSDVSASNSILSGTTGQTVWVTYMLSYSNTNSTLNSLPCNYFNKISGTTTPSQVTLKFDNNLFGKMGTSLSDIKTKFIAKYFYILVQKTNTGSLPTSDGWKIMDYTSEVSVNGSGFIIPSGLTGTTFTITESDYNSATPFDLESYMTSTNYLGSVSNTSEPQFGDEQPFPGSIKLVRATDIQVLNFLINLPSTQFTESQNPTYSIGKTKKITEVALLDGNKETLIIAKSAVPITRSGTQVIQVRLDF
jgi:hypothetical protein